MGCRMAACNAERCSSELPPISLTLRGRCRPNLFLVKEGLVDGDIESNPYWNAFQELGYAQGKGVHIWTTQEDICDNVAQGGFSRASESLLSSLQKWTRDTPQPQILVCGSRGARLISRLIAEGKQLPPMLALNGMLYYQCLPPDALDTFEFWSPEFPHMKVDKVMREHALRPPLIPREVAPRVVVTSGAEDTLRRLGPSGNRMRFAPLYLLQGLASCLPEMHLYWKEEDGHYPQSLRDATTLGLLLQLTAYGRSSNDSLELKRPPTDAPEIEKKDAVNSLGLSDDELSLINESLRAGSELCQRDADPSL